MIDSRIGRGTACRLAGSAAYAAITAFIGAVILLALGILGLRHDTRGAWNGCRGTSRDRPTRTLVRRAINSLPVRGLAKCRPLRVLPESSFGPSGVTAG